MTLLYITAAMLCWRMLVFVRNAEPRSPDLVPIFLFGILSAAWPILLFNFAIVLGAFVATEVYWWAKARRSVLPLAIVHRR